MLPIILAIENEEERSFIEYIYDKYSKYMYKIANEVLNNHHDAEDVVHDIIIKIIDKADKLLAQGDGDSLKKLIVITTRNQAITKYNKNRKISQNTISSSFIDEDGYLHEKDIIDPYSNVEDIVECEENIKILQGLIDNLDPKYRDVFVLMSQGFTNQEISDIMNISIETVRQRYHRGKKLILEEGGDAFYGIK